ncbi:uncharacterized protein EI90DRAFT_2233181 [Cantharellus anzutake]|uniref:uncharacterized protein n=1 Tax=Cantharellus anzutake TaxID=1750568 RepID=UPI001904A34F|nr:uncharacterized protein EI90DRAFT_2233181 [Cantharellus anzutake]KAF8324793.1 hypothetical protein EI90DRAFT_2233181 [Cantharellus anzutake]
MCSTTSPQGIRYRPLPKCLVRNLEESGSSCSLRAFVMHWAFYFIGGRHKLFGQDSFSRSPSMAVRSKVLARAGYLHSFHDRSIQIHDQADWTMLTLSTTIVHRGQGVCYSLQNASSNKSCGVMIEKRMNQETNNEALTSQPPLPNEKILDPATSRFTFGASCRTQISTLRHGQSVARHGDNQPLLIG